MDDENVFSQSSPIIVIHKSVVSKVYHDNMICLHQPGVRSLMAPPLKSARSSSSRHQGCAWKNAGSSTVSALRPGDQPFIKEFVILFWHPNSLQTHCIQPSFSVPSGPLDPTAIRAFPYSSRFCLTLSVHMSGWSKPNIFTPYMTSPRLVPLKYDLIFRHWTTSDQHDSDFK